MHRNTVNFQHMAERTHYLTVTPSADNLQLYALDKNGYVSTWSMLNGEFKSKEPISSEIDVTGFDVDREVYDRDWFDGPTLIQKKEAHNENMAAAIINKRFKVIELNPHKGTVTQRLEFTHSHSKTSELHLYLSTDFTKMIEMLVSKSKKATYNQYLWEVDSWNFDQTL